MQRSAVGCRGDLRVWCHADLLQDGGGCVCGAVGPHNRRRNDGQIYAEERRRIQGSQENRVAEIRGTSPCLEETTRRSVLGGGDDERSTSGMREREGGEVRRVAVLGHRKRAPQMRRKKYGKLREPRHTFCGRLKLVTNQTLTHRSVACLTLGCGV